MKGLGKILRCFALVAASGAVFSYGSDRAAASRELAPSNVTYVYANEDLAYPLVNQVSFYQAEGTQLSFYTARVTGGYGIQGGFFGSARVNSIPSASAPCLYISNAGDNTVSS